MNKKRCLLNYFDRNRFWA